MKSQSAFRSIPAGIATGLITLASVAAIACAVAHANPSGRTGANESSAIIQWANASGGFFDVNTNWSSGSAPGAFDSASFALNNTYSVDWDAITGNTTTDDLFVTAGEVTLRSVNSSTTGVVYSHTLNDSLIVG
ncbi:MAG: hypothetical protein AAF456_14750, partial [Planctomycetota bacterium]